MMKRIIGIIIFILIVMAGLQLVDLYKESQLTENQKNLKSFFEDEGHVIKVLMPESYYFGSTMYSEIEAIANNIIMKEFDYDDKVSFEIIQLDVDNRIDYLREKNLLLSKENGPALIMVTMFSESINEYVDNAIVDDVRDRLTNYENIYDFLAHDYFVPMGLYSRGTILNTDVLEDLNMPIPEADWSSDDLYKIQQAWFEDHDVYIERTEFNRIYDRYFVDVSFVDLTGRVYVDTDENLEKILAIRDEFISDNYKTLPNMEIEDIQALILGTSELSREDRYKMYKDNENGHYIHNDWINTLHPFSSYHPLQMRPLKLLPSVDKGQSHVYEVGFLINSNGGNKTYAIELLDHLISDKYQFYIYEKKFMYGIAPSISSIEEEIKNKHPRTVGKVEKRVEPFAFEARDQLINDLYSGRVIARRKTREENILESSFKSLVIELAFNETYFTKEQIRDKLKKFEREAYLKINE